jgi:hypothetical protein
MFMKTNGEATQIPLYPVMFKKNKPLTVVTP